MFLQKSLIFNRLFIYQYLSTMRLLSGLRQFFNSLQSTFFPRYCVVCGKRLSTAEEFTCIKCLAHLPLTGIKGKKGNIIERILWDYTIDTQRANSFLFYYPKSPYCNIYFHFKYYGHPDVAVAYGKLMAGDLIDTGFFTGIDCIVPVPLSAKRFRKRGYNQSERLAFGVSLVTGLPVITDAVARKVDNSTQTRLTTQERKENVENIFALVDAETLNGKHVLLIDDIITTGSTLKSCAYAVMQAKDVKLSVLTLGTSAKNRQAIFPENIYV